jgi:hypothetical protein
MAVMFVLLLLVACTWQIPSAQAQTTTILCGQKTVGATDVINLGTSAEVTVYVGGTVYLYAQPAATPYYWTEFQGTMSLSGLLTMGDIIFVTYPYNVATESTSPSGGLGSIVSVTGKGTTILTYLLSTTSIALWNVDISTYSFTAPVGTQVTTNVEATTGGQDTGQSDSAHLTTCSAPFVYITQSGSTLTWYISGLTPSARFTVSESTSQGFTDSFAYTSSSSGTDSRAFNYGGGTAGDVVTLSVVDTTSGRTATTSYTVQSTLAISVTQTSGQYPVWHISGLTQNGPFTVTEKVGSTQYNSWAYTASGTTDSRAFNPNGVPVGTTITLTVKDTDSGKSVPTTWTLLSYP